MSLWATKGNHSWTPRNSPWTMIMGPLQLHHRAVLRTARRGLGRCKLQGMRPDPVTLAEGGLSLPGSLYGPEAPCAWKKRIHHRTLLPPHLSEHHRCAQPTWQSSCTPQTLLYAPRYHSASPSHLHGLTKYWWEALRGLGALPKLGPSYGEAIVECLEDKEEVVRVAACRAVWILGGS